MLSIMMTACAAAYRATCVVRAKCVPRVEFITDLDHFNMSEEEVIRMNL